MNYIEKAIELGLKDDEKIWDIMKFHCPDRYVNLGKIECEHINEGRLGCIKCWTKERDL